MQNFIPIAKPYIDQKDKQAVMKVLESGYLSLGPQYEKFEQKFADFIGAKYATSVVNGTCGLHLAVKVSGLNKGDEVITTPFSFVASSNCLLYEDVKPVFVDIEDQTYHMDPRQIESKITKRTKAILVVHIFGQTADMEPILKLARKYNLKIIEDACEGLGATYKSKYAGTFGNIGVYAFYPNKQMTTGEGGMIVSRNKSYTELCKSLRNQGRTDDGQWMKHEYLGYNYRLSEISAALGIQQLVKVPWFIKKRQEIASWYEKYLGGVKDVVTPKVGSNRTHTWFVYVIRIKNGKRDFLMQRLNQSGIQTRPYFPVIHLQPLYMQLFNLKPNDYPVAENVASETLALPIFVGLKKEQVKFITSKLTRLLHEK